MIFAIPGTLSLTTLTHVYYYITHYQNSQFLFIAIVLTIVFRKIIRVIILTRDVTDVPP